MAEEKQYFNTSNPGDNLIESRSGAKMVMDTKGSITLTSVRSKEFLDELRKTKTISNTSQNADEDSSYIFIGEGNVPLNNQGNKNQDSTNLTSKSNPENVIEPVILNTNNEPLPFEEIKPTPTPPPSVSPPLVSGEIFIEDFTGLPEFEFSSQLQTFDNTDIPETGTGYEKILTTSEKTQLINQLSGKVYNKNNISFNIISKGGKLTAEAQLVLNSCKSSNAVNSAIRMNPTNYNTIVNNNLSQFSYGGEMHSIIIAKMLCPANFFCAAGVSTSFIAANGNDKAGGFPISNSSQIVLNLNGVIIMNRNIDYTDTGLTASGLSKFQSISQFKGAVFTITRRDGTGHAGLILGVEMSNNEGILYTLEFNTGTGIKGDSRSYGVLAFRKRRVGGSWVSRKKPTNVDIKFSIAPTNQYGGGIWSPNGLINDNTFETIGSWKKNKFIFK